MTGIFRANNPLNTFLLFVYGILLKFVWLLHPQVPVARETYGFLFNDPLSFIHPFLEAYPTTCFILSYLLLFTQALGFNQVISSRRMMQKPNYLPAMSYLLITSFFSEWNILSAPLIVNSLLIWIWAKMSILNNRQHPKSTLYNVGIAIGICSFLYLPSFAFALIILFSLIISRPPKAAEWLITFIGILTPWYFLVAWLFFTNHLYSFHLSGFGFSYPVYTSLTPELLALILILLLTIAGGLFVQFTASKQIVQVRKNWGSMLVYLLVTLAITFVNTQFHFEGWLPALVPVAAFIGCAFYYPRIRWVASLVQWMLVGFVFYMQYFR